MIKLLSVEFGRCGAIRRYQHPQLGLLPIVTTYGRAGGADVINLTPVAQFIRQRNAARRRPLPRRRGPKPVA